MKLYNTYKYSIKEYKERIKIEQIFGILKFNKRLCCRYDKLLSSYSSFTHLAFSIIAINIFKNIKHN